MKKIAFFLLLIIPLFATAQETEYKLNARTGKFDLVRSASWLNNNLPDSLVEGRATSGQLAIWDSASKIVGSSSLVWNSENSLFEVNGDINLTNGKNYKINGLNLPNGSGITNYIPLWSGTSTLGNSVIYTDGSGIAIGTTAIGPYKLYVNGSAYTSGNTTGIGYFRTSEYFGASKFTSYGTTYNSIEIFPQNNSSSFIRFGVGNNNSTFTTEWGRFQGGYLGLGTNNPTSALHINKGTGTLATGITFNNGGTGIYEQADDELKLQVNGELYYVKIVSSEVSFKVGQGVNYPKISSDLFGTEYAGIGEANYGTVIAGANESGDFAFADSKIIVYSGYNGVTIIQYTAALTDGTPTDTEIDTATGLTPATAGAGYQVTIKDSNGTGLLYKVESDGTYWYYSAMTKAL